MKKFIISILPLLIITFFLLWFSWGLEGVITFVCAVVFLIISAKGMVKWIEFVDEHIK